MDMLVNIVMVTLMFTIGIAAVRQYAAVGAAAALLVSSAIAAAIRIQVFAREIRRSTWAAPQTIPPIPQVASQNSR